VFRCRKLLAQFCDTYFETFELFAPCRIERAAVSSTVARGDLRVPFGASALARQAPP
jgi:hypothetical protein